MNKITIPICVDTLLNSFICFGLLSGNFGFVVFGSLSVLVHPLFIIGVILMNWIAIALWADLEEKPWAGKLNPFQFKGDCSN